MEGVIVLL